MLCADLRWSRTISSKLFKMSWALINNNQLNCIGYQIYRNDWLIDYLLFYVSLKNFSLIWRRHHYRRSAAKWPMPSSQGLWAGRGPYHATPTVTRDLGFFRSHPKDRPHSVASYVTHGGAEDSNPDPHGAIEIEMYSSLITLLINVWRRKLHCK
jgi:hypothetical protein